MNLALALLKPMSILCLKTGLSLKVAATWTFSDNFPKQMNTYTI